jgi:hypothetical protein
LRTNFFAEESVGFYERRLNLAEIVMKGFGSWKFSLKRSFELVEVDTIFEMRTWRKSSKFGC